MGESIGFQVGVFHVLALHCLWSYRRDPNADSPANTFNEKATAGCAPKAARLRVAIKQDVLFDALQRKRRDALSPLRQAWDRVKAVREGEQEWYEYLFFPSLISPNLYFYPLSPSLDITRPYSGQPPPHRPGRQEGEHGKIIFDIMPSVRPISLPPSPP